MFVLVRAVTYSTLFVGFLLVFLPERLLAWSGAVRPAVIGPAQLAGMAVAANGGALALWCIVTFVFVARGPYRYVRNPMYLGAAIAMAGAALFFRSAALAGYAAGFLLVTHAFVLGYEEPTLRASFGAEYDRYCQTVRRWWPKP